MFTWFRLSGLTGMRRGEVCALRRSDVDLDRAQVRVVRQLGVVGGRPLFAEHPKSDYGRRTIDLDAETVRVIRRLWAAQAERKLAIGGGWGEGNLVFTDASGGPLNPESVSQFFRRRVRTAGVSEIRLHDLGTLTAPTSSRRSEPE